MSPRSAKSLLRKIQIHSRSKKLTLAAAAATIAVTGSVSAGVAAGSAGASANASTVPVVKAAGDHSNPIHTLQHVGPARQDGQAHAARRTVSHAAGRPVSHPAPPRHAPPRPDSCHSGPQVNQWVCQAERIMTANGTPRSAVDTGAGVIVAMHESGGDPSASNGWDSNAAAGTPSQGIAQVIGPTFATYHLPGHDDIWNPVDNMVAAFRYAVARYGSMGNIPGVQAVRSGGSYVGY